MNKKTNKTITPVASLQQRFIFGLLLLGALVAFEIFNFSTTDAALTNLLGDLQFLNLTWATILAIAFCMIDFTGIARMFSPKQTDDSSEEVWYMFGAWLIAALLNAVLTWWGVSSAILEHETLGNAIVSRETLLRVVPIVIAVMVWLIRVLIIGTLTLSGNQIFNSSQSPANNNREKVSTKKKTRNTRIPQPAQMRPSPRFRSSPSPAGTKAQSSAQELTYHPISQVKTYSDGTHRAQL